MVRRKEEKWAFFRILISVRKTGEKALYLPGRAENSSQRCAMPSLGKMRVGACTVKANSETQSRMCTPGPHMAWVWAGSWSSSVQLRPSNRQETSSSTRTTGLGFEKKGQGVQVRVLGTLPTSMAGCTKALVPSAGDWAGSQIYKPELSPRSISSSEQSESQSKISCLLLFS